MTATKYELIDNQTKAIVGTYKTRVSASRAANRKDIAYGAVRYVVRPVYPAITAPALPAPASRIGVVCGPCERPKDNAGTVLCHVTDRWGTHAVVMMDSGKMNTCHGLTTVGIGFYQL